MHQRPAEWRERDSAGCGVLNRCGTDIRRDSIRDSRSSPKYAHVDQPSQFANQSILRTLKPREWTCWDASHHYTHEFNKKKPEQAICLC